MELYGAKSKSTPQKITIVVIEIILIWISYGILFGDYFSGIKNFGSSPLFERNLVLFIFNLIVFLRLLLTFFYFIERKIPFEEAISVSIAFALYLIGFPLLAASNSIDFGILGITGIFLFLLGSSINSVSEFQRKKFKTNPKNKGKLFTKGLFSLSMHINYFGDLLWVTGYALVTRNVYSVIIPLFLFSFFYFYNIPKLDNYLENKYSQQFTEYRQITRRFIPFML